MATLPDELLEDIFLRLSTPADLARAAAVCASFRRVATDRRFLRRFLQPLLHPLPLLGFLEHRGRGGFHRAEEPYRSAPAARVAAQAAADLAACDPLHRLYVRIPTVPGDLLSSSAAPYHDGVELEHFLAPDRPGDEKDEPAFQVICSARSWYGAVVFVFSSATGNWSRAASVSFLLCLSIKDPKALVRYYACGCFCWVNAWDRHMLVLDPLGMELSLVELARIQATRCRELAVVDAGEHRLCVVALGFRRHRLCAPPQGVAEQRVWPGGMAVHDRPLA